MILKNKLLSILLLSFPPSIILAEETKQIDFTKYEKKIDKKADYTKVYIKTIPFQKSRKAPFILYKKESEEKFYLRGHIDHDIIFQKFRPFPDQPVITRSKPGTKKEIREIEKQRVEQKKDNLNFSKVTREYSSLFGYLAQRTTNGGRPIRTQIYSHEKDFFIESKKDYNDVLISSFTCDKSGYNHYNNPELIKDLGIYRIYRYNVVETCEGNKEEDEAFITYQTIGYDVTFKTVHE